MKIYKNYYAILYLFENATNLEIKKNYHRLALELHPDKLTEKEQDLKKFHDLTEAYNILKNSKLRSEYNHHKIDPSVYMFIKAISSNLSVEELEELHYYGALLDIRNNKGQNLLMIAANRGNLAVVKYLINHNVSANSVDNDLTSPLIFACIGKLVHFSLPEIKITQPNYRVFETKNYTKPEEVEISKQITNSPSQNLTQNAEADVLLKEPIVENIEKQEETPKEKEDIKTEDNKTDDANESEQQQEFPKAQPIVEGLNQLKFLPEIVKQLLDAGADPISPNIFNISPIAYASYFHLNKNIEIISDFVNSHYNQ
jgi:curved DNA-binding protein CbpA